MSIEAMSIALHHSRASGTAKLVLMGIANHDGEGGSWPSHSTLARYANVDVRNVRRAIDKLKSLGEINVKVQAGGIDLQPHERPNLYEFRLTCPSDCDGSTQHRTRRGRQAGSKVELTGFTEDNSAQGAETPRGATAPRGAWAPAPPKPSLEPLATDSKSTYVAERAREALCDTTGQPHRINRKLRYCADCLTPLALLTAPNRKEGAA